MLKLTIKKIRKRDVEKKINQQLKFVVENCNRKRFDRKTIDSINEKLFELCCRNLKLTKLAR